MLLDHRIVFADSERVAMLLRASGFAVEAEDVIGKTVREIAWRFGRTVRDRKTVIAILDAAIDIA